MHPQLDPNPLELWIHDRIRASGPVTFAQFMAWALYHPQYGYYTAGPHIGPRGDFTTSPEASPAFGRLLAQHLQEIDTLLGSPPTFDTIECGPGRGTLASDTLDTLHAEHPDLYARLRYHLVEISPALAATQAERLSLAHASVVSWHTSLAEIEPGRQGAVIANELVDAFPVHILENRDGDILEQFVTLDTSGKLAIVLLPPSDPALSAFLAEAQLELQPGERIEVNLAANAWLADLSTTFDRGVATIIDYGDLAPARYSPARREGTLLAYYAGAVTDHVLSRPGQQDITALVDFTALQIASMRAGFDIVAMTRQANFLLGLGLGTTLTSDSYNGALQDALDYRRGMQALVSMEGLGRFHVLLLSKGLDQDQAAALSALKYASL